MTLRRFHCRACGIVFSSDLELSEEFLELRFCPTCGNAGHLAPDSEEFTLCAVCRDSLPPEADEAEPDPAFIQ